MRQETASRLTFEQGHWSVGTAESCPAPPVVAERYYSIVGGENMILNNHLMQWHSIRGPPGGPNTPKCTQVGFKWIVHSKILILSSFTHPQVVPNLYYFISSAEHNILKYVGNQTLTFIVVFLHTMEVNGAINYMDSSKIFFCVEQLTL